MTTPPLCPRCRTPAARACGSFVGPCDNLWCAVCCRAWLGSPEDLARAERADAEMDAEQREREQAAAVAARDAAKLARYQAWLAARKGT